MVNKYGAKKVKTPTGETFDSQKEYNRYRELLLLARAGKIHDVIRQVKFELIPAQYKTVYTGEVYKRTIHARGIAEGMPKTKEVCLELPCVYIADFVYWEGDKMIVEDVKGYKKGAAYELFKIKRKLMLWVHGIKIKET